MNHAELVMRRRNVLAFIIADPVQVTLTRTGEPTKTEAGGFLPGTETTLAPQQARIVQNKRRYNPGLINAEAGDIPKTDYLMIMTYDKDVEEEDSFFWAGDKYKVVGIHGLRTESILCSIDFFGPKNRAS